MESTEPLPPVLVKTLHVVTSRGRIALLALAAKAMPEGDLGFKLLLQRLTQDVCDPPQLERRKFPIARGLPNRLVSRPKKCSDFLDRQYRRRRQRLAFCGRSERLAIFHARNHSTSAPSSRPSNDKRDREFHDPARCEVHDHDDRGARSLQEGVGTIRVDRQGAGERISSLLRRVIAFEAESTGRILQKNVEIQIFKDTSKEIDSSLDRCLRDDTPPIAENAWLIGEALNTLGVRWMSGLTALFATGRLKEFVRTLAIAIENTDDPLTKDDYSTLRRLLSEQHWLVFSLAFDFDPIMLGLHVGINDNNDALVRRSVRACCRPFQTLSDDAVRTFEAAFIAREKAKRKWLRYDSLRERFNRAFAARERKATVSHRISQALETIASSKMSSADKERIVLDIFDSWLGDLENYGIEDDL